MNDVDVESGLLNVIVEREGEFLIPEGRVVALLIDMCRAFVFGVDPQDDVGLEWTVAPVDVFEVFGGGKGDFQFVKSRHDQQVQEGQLVGCSRLLGWLLVIWYINYL